MVNKFPWMPFYPADYVADTRTLSQEEKGCWMDLICHLWMGNFAGEISTDYESLGRIWGMVWPKAKEIIWALQKKGICDVTSANAESESSITVNGAVMIICRRMKRESFARIKNANRVRKFRDVRTRNASVTRYSQKSQVRKEPRGASPTPGKTNGHAPEFMEPIGDEKPSQLRDLTPAPIKPWHGKPKTVRSVTEPVRKLLICMKAMQEERDVKDETLNRIYINRFADDAEDLIEIFHHDYKLAVQCLADLGGEFRAKGLNWTLATIIRHAGEWKVKHANGNPQPR